MSELLLPGYQLRTGSTLDRALLVKFMHLTYQELYPQQNFAHLAETVDQYFSPKTPLWWVDVAAAEVTTYPQPVACLWLGNVVDQVYGDRHSHIFLLYVTPHHRRRGLGSALVKYAQKWASDRGDRQISLQVFLANEPALNLYKNLGFQAHSLWMLKPLQKPEDE